MISINSNIPSSLSPDAMVGRDGLFKEGVMMLSGVGGGGGVLIA